MYNSQNIKELALNAKQRVLEFWNNNKQDVKQTFLQSWKVVVAFVLGISLGLMYVTSQSNTTPTAPQAAAPIPEAEIKSDVRVEKPKFLSIVDTKERLNYSNTDLFCMAKNIYHEAGHEPVVGRYAVAQVTLNRMENEQYPDTVCGVVLQNKQFSWANNHGRRWTTPSGPAWEASKRIAEDVIVGGKRVYGLDNALFYHATYVRPSWARAKKKLTRIGAHIFYRPKH